MTEGQTEAKVIKQKIVLDTIYWLLLQKVKAKGNQKAKVELAPAIKLARNILRKKLDKPSFNLRPQFVVWSLSRDKRFVLPPTCCNGFQTVQLTKSLELFAPSEISIYGRRATYFELLSMLFELETEKMEPEVQKEIQIYLAA